MAHAEKNIPEQRQGTEVNVEDSASFETAEEAIAFFKVAKERLLTINKWKEMAGALSAGFQLTDKHGRELDTQPQPGDYFKIDLPAPGIISGEGFDWVHIEDLHEELNASCEIISMRVRPAASPIGDKSDVAHFYTDAATSNFVVKRENVKVTVGVYGRNEVPNTKSDTILDKARNAVIGTGAIHGLAKLQWRALVKGILER